MLAIGDVKNGGGVPFLVSAGIVFEIIAYCCSSPQTMELNAEKRAPTLMKYVHIGQAQSAGFLAVAVILDKKNRVPILLGGGLAMGISEVLYRHAMVAGLTNPGPPTEQYESQEGESYGRPY